MDGLRIAAAQWPADLEVARTLLRHYEQHLRSGPAGATHICIEGYDAELADLPRFWGGRHAALLLARQPEGAMQPEVAMQPESDMPGDQAIGCVAVHLLPNRPGACELKRMWVEPAGRGAGLGRTLLQAAVAWARERGAQEMLLDTAPEAMPEAGRLYASAGFAPYVRYNSNPVPGIVFLRLLLR